MVEYESCGSTFNVEGGYCRACRLDGMGGYTLDQDASAGPKCVKRGVVLGGEDGDKLCEDCRETFEARYDGWVPEGLQDEADDEDY